MLNVLKKVDELRHGTGGVKGKSLEPPKNLPDLARDMYEREQFTTTYTDTTPASSTTIPSSTKDVTPSTYIPATTKIVQNVSRDIIRDSKPLVEPGKDSVPRLDMSLVKQHIAASEAAIQSIPTQSNRSSIHNVQSNIQSTIQPASSYDNQIMQSIALSNNIQSNNVDDSSGFFKEFEEHIRNNGLANDIVDDLLNKNWLDHMQFYHTTKGDNVPFYATSAELSHAIKLKLEDLQNLERNWIMNKQKIDLLQKFGSTVESDIHLKSEELKKLMLESKKRSVVVNSGLSNNSNNVISASGATNSVTKSNDFFHIVKPKTVENVSTSISHPAPLMQQHPTAVKYPLNKYVVSDSSKYFYAQNGQVFRSLDELMDGLESMDVNTFNYHVNETKNDFSNWIKGTFGDYRLSDVIRSLTDREKLWYFLKNNTI